MYGVFSREVLIYGTGFIREIEILITGGVYLTICGWKNDRELNETTRATSVNDNHESDYRPPPKSCVNLQSDV